jgi:hypothetical protein
VREEALLDPEETMSWRRVVVEVAKGGYVIRGNDPSSGSPEQTWVETEVEPTLERVLECIAPYRATGIKVKLEDPLDVEGDPG